MNGDELRALVREVLRDTLPVTGSAGLGVVAVGDGSQVTDVTDVTVSTDAELSALVRRIATDCADEQRRADLVSGRTGYRLAATRVEPVVPEGGPIRVERGALTERHVREAARAGTSIVAARGVVVTPLARDRARTSGVDIERER